LSRQHASFAKAGWWCSRRNRLRARANALDASAVRKIYALKGRPATSPLIVHVASIEQAKELAAEWLPEAERLARQYWPGPLTIVVPKKSAIPDEVTAGLPTVGLRMPRHPVALELLRAAGVPIAAPERESFHANVTDDGRACSRGIWSGNAILARRRPVRGGT